MKSLYIAEKPSVAQEFANALKSEDNDTTDTRIRRDAIVTWCVGHLITMSYPEAYDLSVTKMESGNPAVSAKRIQIWR